MPHGYGNLVAAWGASVPVALNTRVDAIDWSGKQARVETSQGVLKAKSVLCTVSTGVLAASDIRFSPALPDWKTDSILGLPTGTENKIALHFERDVFGADGRGFHNVWNDDGEAAGFEASLMGQNIAIVFTGGRHAIWLEKQGQQAGQGRMRLISAIVSRRFSATIFANRSPARSLPPGRPNPGQRVRIPARYRDRPTNVKSWHGHSRTGCFSPAKRPLQATIPPAMAPTTRAFAPPGR